MNTRTALIGAALLVVAVVLLIVLSGGEDSNDDTTTGGSAVGNEAKDSGGKNGGGKQSGGEAAKPEVTTIEVGKDGKPVGGITEITVSKGDQVQFEVKSAIAEEIHVHGYDLMKDVPAGGSVSFDFPAEIEGIFEAELEGEGEQILELKVEP